MASRSPIIYKKERANTVRPQKEFAGSSLNLMPDQIDESKAEDDQQVQDSWEVITKKHEELETRMAELFDDKGGDDKDAPPIIRAPTKPTKEAWERHQTTHAPYVAWCPHCMAARHVRRNHPIHGRKVRFVPGTEKGGV